MKYMWFEYKEQAINLRKRGMSYREIEKLTDVPRSTLSSWLKNIELTSDQKLILSENQKHGLANARLKAAIWHNEQKSDRLRVAKEEAIKVLDGLKFNSQETELALAMLYFGEGKKSVTTSIGNSNPLIIKFFLSSLLKIYSIDINKIRFYLHLRDDQNSLEIQRYWATELGIENLTFSGIYYDKRTRGRPTYDSYKGVCVIDCGNIAIQRRLKYIYTMFCKRVLNEGD